MRKFDTTVQYLKYKVLREVSRLAWNDELLENLYEIPKTIIPGKESTMRCCIYKERALIEERVKIAMGGHKENPNVIEVIETACDECPMGGYEVTNACRGCLAHRCENACRFGAITFDKNHAAVIDKTKCKECGACAKVCPYTAIINRKRPCENACKIKAIHMNDDKAAAIDNDKCTSCGACVYQCPFGAIADKSYILDVIDIIKRAIIIRNLKYMPLLLHRYRVSLHMQSSVRSLRELRSSDFIQSLRRLSVRIWLPTRNRESLSKRDSLQAHAVPRS